MTPVVCPSATERYLGKKVIFRILLGDRPVSRSGTFDVRVARDQVFMWIETPGLALPGDPPDMVGRRLNLSQRHVDAIVRSKDPEGEFDFLVRVPFDLSDIERE